MWTPNRVVAVDPGLMSGIAIFELDGGSLTLEHSDELHWQELGECCDSVFSDGGESMAVVVERFTITVQTAKNSQAPWSLECIGMLQWLAYKHGVADFVLQAPVQAKQMFPNERLHTLGFWHRGGEGHARDAIRHGLLYAVQHRWRDEKLLNTPT